MMRDEIAKPEPTKREVTRQDVLLRIGAAILAIGLAALGIEGYALTATIVGHFLSLPDKPAKAPDDGVVTVKVLPAPAKPSPDEKKPH